MSNEKDLKKVMVDGHKLKCPVCGNEKFWHRTTLMNTRGATFLKWDWVNKSSNNYVCSNCGYVFWFL